MHHKLFTGFFRIDSVEVNAAGNEGREDNVENMDLKVKKAPGDPRLVQHCWTILDRAQDGSQKL